IGGEKRLVNFQTPGADPTVAAISVAQATQTLTDALHNLPDLAAQQAAAPHAPEAAAPHGGMTLALDEIEHTDMSMRLNPPKGFASLPPAKPLAALATPLQDVLVPLELDALTAVDDPSFFATLKAEPNLPRYLAPALAKAYGAT